MKFGMRKPSLKRSIKARTTGKLKRKIKKAFVPGYGKKGVGWLKNPKKALYNKVYNKTTFSVSDLFKFNFSSKSKTASKAKKSEVGEGVTVKNKEKAPFYKRKWFIILVSIFVPVAGIVFALKSKKMNKFVKIVLTVIASLWSMILLIIGFADTESDDTANPDTNVPTTVIEEVTTHGNTVYETTTVESTAEATTSEITTEESTTKPTTTKKETTTANQTTTKKETTTKKVTTTAKPTTTKKETTTSKPTTTKKVSTTNREDGISVYYTKSGSKYHYENPCGNGTYYETSLSKAKAMGLGACEKCVLQ